MRNYASLQALIQELENDAREIERLRSRNETAWERIRQGANDPVDWGALGFTIQTLYGVLENYFLRISKYFENNLPGERWHMGLVEKMRLDIPNVRPAFVETAAQLGEVRQILRFRHRLRHLYGEDLDPAKTREIQEVVESFFQTFPALHQRFSARLRSIADAL
jgi:hypothetical protein